MTAVSELVMSDAPTTPAIQEHINGCIEDVLQSLPNPDTLSSSERRGIIARYTAVLEGNFIYWMTGAYFAVGSDAARSKIRENLLEEVRDSHPEMLRRFAVAARAVPTDSDAEAVSRDLTNVRMFIGRLSPVPIVITMAFFEGLIQRFMPYLADLARREGSADFEYTDVHGVCDVTHTEELFRALESEIALGPNAVSGKDLYEGVKLLRTLLLKIIAN